MASLLLGLDLGQAALGFAFELHAAGETVQALEVVRTERSDRKRAVRESDDAVRRLVEIAAALERRINPGVVALAVEAQSCNASSSAKVGMAWGAIAAAVAQRHGLPVLQASPQEVKRALTGRKDASKADVQCALEIRYPDLPDWPPQRDRVEHAADALAAVVACRDHAVIKLARRMAGATGGAA